MSGDNQHVLGNVQFGPARSLWEEQPSLRELYDQACQGLIRGECEAEELRAEVAMLQEQARILADERDEARGEVARLREALSKWENEKWCDECGHPLSQCGDQNDDGEPEMDCFRCRTLFRLKEAKAESARLLKRIERERDEAVQERERWKMQAEEKWGMRRELEELLGVGDTESEEQFAKGLAALRDLLKERDEARDLLERKWDKGDPPLVRMMGERDEAREKAERYRLEANVMMAKLHELQTYADKLADGLPAGMLPRDIENLREANAGLADDLQKAVQERDEALMKYRTTELLGMALVKTIDELKAEKAAIFAQLVSLQAGSRRATLDEIAESVREKYEPEHEGEGMENG